MFKNPYLVIGITGLFITAVINLILVFTSEPTFSFMYTFYIVWIVFFVIGMTQVFGKKGKRS